MPPALEKLLFKQALLGIPRQMVSDKILENIELGRMPVEVEQEKEEGRAHSPVGTEITHKWKTLGISNMHIVTSTLGDSH
jgi:hypothetical protein